MDRSVEPFYRRLLAIPDLEVTPSAPLSAYTRFGIGGAAALFAETLSTEAFVSAFRLARDGGFPCEVIGGGTNLIVSDDGFDGLVLRYRAGRILHSGDRVMVDAGAELQALVDYSIERGLKGLETMTGIPGWVGGAIYGNAGAYGHSISERVLRVRYFDGGGVRVLDNDACLFAYRESVFKRNKDWIIFSAELRLDPGDPAALRETAAGIRRIRDAKYPPTMKCAGSIFKNCLLAELPPAVAARVPDSVVREGKVPSAWFLEQVGAKGLRRGDIQVAHYHANLIYNDGRGTAADLCAIIDDLTRRVHGRFGFVLQQEVQFVGVPDRSV